LSSLQLEAWRSEDFVLQTSAMFHGQAVQLLVIHNPTPSPCYLTVVKCFRAQFNVITLDPRSNYYKFRLLQVYAIGSGLKFYNLHQTLNISINVLKSFTDIYCISSARSGFVFFISFTSFFLTFIMSSSYIIWDVLSSLKLGA